MAGINNNNNIPSNLSDFGWVGGRRGLGWFIEEGDGLREKTVQVSGGSGPDGSEPAA